MKDAIDRNWQNKGKNDDEDELNNFSTSSITTWEHIKEKEKWMAKSLNIIKNVIYSIFILRDDDIKSSYARFFLGGTSSYLFFMYRFQLMQFLGYNK